jgi:hypothetical protein
MRDYGRVYASFWTSPDIQSLSDDGRLLALYLLSGPHGTLAGVFRLPEGYVCEDLKWTSKRVSKGFHELFRKGFINRCETTNWVWIRKFLTWNRPENPNQWKSARKLAAQVPTECSFYSEFIEVFEAICSGKNVVFANGSETVSKVLPKPLPTQEQEQEQEQKGSKEPRASRRCPEDFEPDPEYALREIPDLDLPREIQKFRDWEFKTPRKDWAACWRTWISNAKEQRRYAKKITQNRIDPRDWQ